MNSRGFALLATLWLVVALAAVGLAWGLEARTHRLAAANLIEASAARAAAEAGLAHAHARLAGAMEPGTESGSAGGARLTIDPWEEPHGLAPDTQRVGDAGYIVTLADAGAKLNLNTATEAQLREFLRALRVDYGEADRIAQAIADWRDPDDLHRARGAEADWYIRAGAWTLPRNGPFQHVRELGDVRGATERVLERALPYLTIRGSGRVNVNAASRPVLLSLPGVGPDVADALERLRRQGRRLSTIADLGPELPLRSRHAFLDAVPQLLQLTTTATVEVEVDVEAWREGGPIRARAEGLFVRSGDALILTDRRVR